ncbi:MAG: hypothetical protein OEV08_09445, partial [Nitrospira sp.]|nr:hypothetical protein [Nitrospira sp.]
FAAPAIDIEVLALFVQRHRDWFSVPGQLIITLNLGNDLDEMYLGGAWYRGTSEHISRKWMIQHSAAFMWLIKWQYERGLTRNMIPGVNAILRLLGPQERVILAREAVGCITRIRDAVGSTPTIVVVLPQDLQLFPDDFRKYAQYFDDPSKFEEWWGKRQQLAQQMQTLEDYLVALLRGRDFKVVTLAEALPADATASQVFNRFSHHLTPQAHAWLAKAIARQGTY